MLKLNHFNFSFHFYFLTFFRFASVIRCLQQQQQFAAVMYIFRFLSLFLTPSSAPTECLSISRSILIRILLKVNGTSYFFFIHSPTNREIVLCSSFHVKTHFDNIEYFKTSIFTHRISYYVLRESTQSENVICVTNSLGVLQEQFLYNIRCATRLCHSKIQNLIFELFKF